MGAAALRKAAGAGITNVLFPGTKTSAGEVIAAAGAGAEAEIKPRDGGGSSNSVCATALGETSIAPVSDVLTARDAQNPGIRKTVASTGAAGFCNREQAVTVRSPRLVERSRAANA